MPEPVQNSLGEKPKVVAVIPCFNNGLSVVDVVSQTKQYVDQVIVVDDGSLDGTGKMAESAGASVITNDNNVGKGFAMKAAVQATDGDIIVFLDGDGQHDPGDIPRVIDPIIFQGFDIVVGSRHLRGSKISSPELKRRLVNMLASLAISVITNLILPLLSLRKLKVYKSISRKKDREYSAHGSRPSSKKIITDCTSGFRAIRRQCWQELNLVSTGFQIETEMIYEAKRNKLALTEVPITCNWNGNGSRLSIIRDGFRTLMLLLKKLFSDLKTG